MAATTFENQIPKFDTKIALVEENYPGQKPAQLPIVLIVDWTAATVDVSTRDFTAGTPGRVWHGLVSHYLVPANVDATELHDDVDWLLPKLDAIREGYEEVWDGSNFKGRFTEEARELDEAFECSLGDAFSTYDYEEGGLIDPDYWFGENAENLSKGTLTAETTDGKIADLAETAVREAQEADFVIAGGKDAAVSFLQMIRDNLGRGA